MYFDNSTSQKNLKEEELQFLVEGQVTSIDAIRLKEHLVIRKQKNKPDLLPEKDRLRVEELMEGF